MLSATQPTIQAAFDDSGRAEFAIVETYDQPAARRIALVSADAEMKIRLSYGFVFVLAVIHLRAASHMSASRQSLVVALIVVGIALGGCMRERRADHDSASDVTHSANSESNLSPSSTRTIVIVPPSEDVMSHAAAGGAIIRRIMAAAKPAIGTPYKWGGTSLTTGIDCSNFTWLLYRSIGVPYDCYIRTQELATMSRNAGFSQTSFDQARPGDLLVYGYRDDAGDWHGHVVILVDKTGRSTGHKGLVLGAHGTPVSAVQLVTFAGFEQGYFKTPNMRLLNVLRPTEPSAVR